MPDLTMSVSVTTRPMRPGEVDGRDYHFVDKKRFDAMVAKDELLEWATVFDNQLRHTASAGRSALAMGQDVLFDIDWQGTQQLREPLADVVSVFILPPSVAGSGAAAAHACAGFRRGNSRPDEQRRR